MVWLKHQHSDCSDGGALVLITGHVQDAHTGHMRIAVDQVHIEVLNKHFYVCQDVRTHILANFNTAWTCANISEMLDDQCTYTLIQRKLLKKGLILSRQNV